MICENTPTLSTPRLILRRFAPEDAEALFEILSDAETNAFLPWFPLRSLGEAEAFLQERFLASYSAASGYRYAVCLREDNRAAGYVWLADDPSRDFGYALAKNLWHRGIATEAAGAVVERIRGAGHPYITATHDVNNPRSGEVMKKLGMTYRYSYMERWRPKEVLVTFRMYQLDFDGGRAGTYRKYWETYPDHFVEEGL